MNEAPYLQTLYVQCPAPLCKVSFLEVERKSKYELGGCPICSSNLILLDSTANDPAPEGSEQHAAETHH